MISLAIFAWPVAYAPRGIIAGDARRWLSLAVLSNSAAMLAIVPLMSAQPSVERFFGGWRRTARDYLPRQLLGTVRFSGGLALRPSKCVETLRSAATCSHSLGVAAFSTAVAVGLLVVQVASRVDLVARLHRCSPLAVVLALPVLAAGLTVQRGRAAMRRLVPIAWPGPL